MNTTSRKLINSVSGSKTDRELAERIGKSEIFLTYQRAFEIATGLPLALKPVGSFSNPMQKSRKASNFCILMASQTKGCAACLELQQRIESQADQDAVSLECFAGLNESAVPIRVGKRAVAMLQTGQVFLSKPSRAKFDRVLAVLRDRGLLVDEVALEAAYFGTLVLDRTKRDSVIELLRIFAAHLSHVSNQLVAKESCGQSATVVKARSFIAVHLGEEISLSDVARAAGMSIYYFCKTFKREVGLTFTEYLSRMRVEWVKEMLVNPHKRISEAAYEAGFQSLSQFNRVFKQFVGEPPSLFRERLHGTSIPGIQQGDARAV